MSRSGIWYTKNISIRDSALQAPKLFRRASDIELDNVHFSDVEETMWTCKNIKITNSQLMRIILVRIAKIFTWIM